MASAATALTEALQQGNPSLLPDELVIEVTQSDIDNGKPRDIRQCAIATAARRLFPGMEVIVASRLRFQLEPFHPRSVWYTAPGTDDFIKKYDGGKPVKPTTFVFRSPTIDIRRGE